MIGRKRIGVVVLAYNVEAHIEQVIRSMPARVDWVYIVDDGSQDGTLARAMRLSDRRVILLRHDHNRGPGAALMTGYKAALDDHIDIVVKVDGDGQMNTNRIDNLASVIADDEADYAKGDRLSVYPRENGMPLLRLVGNWLLTTMTRVAMDCYSIKDTQNGFTAISSNALRKLLPLGLYHGYGYLNDILVKLSALGYRVEDVPMPAMYGTEKSSIRLPRYIVRVSWLLVKLACWRYWRTRVRTKS